MRDGRRWLKKGCLTLVIFLTPFLVSPAFADDGGTLRALLIRYRCPLVDRFERVYEAGDPTSDADRFVAVTVPTHPHGYVQCIFIEGKTRLLCEASSGFYYGVAGQSRPFHLPQASLAALAKLGFSMDDSKGNFQIFVDVSHKPDFNAVADLVLTALHDAYGARADSPLQANAPFAPRPTARCIPVS